MTVILGARLKHALKSLAASGKGSSCFICWGGTKRFNELMRLMPDVTQRMLTKQLRELEADQIVERKVYPEVPPKVEYGMTAFGRTLAPVLKVVQKWGVEYLDRITAIRQGSA